jgi:hypothetical protein
LILSKLLIVEFVALNESFPAVPVIESTPEVSDLFCTQNDVNTHLFCIYLAIRPYIDSTTTIGHQ